MLVVSATHPCWTRRPRGIPSTERYEHANTYGSRGCICSGAHPLNVLAWTPNQGRYSPLWDVHLSTWAPGQTPTRQSEVANIEDLAAAGKITAFPSGPWGPTGFIVDCPIIAQL